jgi:hypothetical protein
VYLKHLRRIIGAAITMKTSRTILALATMLAISAITAAPAAANYRGLFGTSGSSQLKAGTVATLQVEGGGSAIEVSKAPDTWRIQDSKTEQRVTKEGAHLDQEVNFQEPHIGATPVKINNPIVYQFVQTGPTTADVNISKEIILTIPISETAACTVTLSPANNKQLTKAKDVPIESTKALEMTSEIEHLTSEAKPAETCALAKIKNSTTGLFKQITIEHGVIQV